MGDQDRLDMILAQARIAKAAMIENSGTRSDHANAELEQAILALEAIVLLADPEFNHKFSAN